jgi:hypothetical protein
MANKHSSVCGKITSPFAPDKQQSNQPRIRIFTWGLCLPFLWQVFSRQPIKNVSSRCQSWC